MIQFLNQTIHCSQAQRKKLYKIDKQEETRRQTSERAKAACKENLLTFETENYLTNCINNLSGKNVCAKTTVFVHLMA